MRTVFITGATAGFGEACARRFAKEGWQLIVVGRRIRRIDALKQELHPVPVHGIVVDIRARKAVEKAIAALPEQFRAVDVLINNAGLSLGAEQAQHASVDDWEVMIDTNVKGLLYVTKAIVPGMVERNRGLIINIGSTAGNYPYPTGHVYGATKSFVKQFSLNLRADLLGTKVRVTNVEPGIAETEFAVVRFKGNKEKAANFYRNVHPLRAEDIAEAVYWITTRPPRVNINRLEIMPVNQAFGPFALHREE